MSHNFSLPMALFLPLGDTLSSSNELVSASVFEGPGRSSIVDNSTFASALRFSLLFRFVSILTFRVKS